MASTTSDFAIYVLYPRTAGTSFDYDYYNTKHIHLATEIWGPYSARIHSVTQMDESTGCYLACVVSWADKQSYKRAQDDLRSGEIEADFGQGKFTDAKPILLAGKAMA